MLACAILGAAPPARHPSPPPARATASPAPAPSRPPHGPVIYAVWATPRVIHGGDLVQWTVRTSNDVTRVTAGIPTYEFTLERRSSGRFFTAFRIPPDVPPFFRRDYQIVVTAFGPGGRTQTNMTMRFQ